MPGRYKTPGEKAGVKRRVKSFRERQQEAGLKERPFWLTDPETQVLRGVVAEWRGKPNVLDERQREAAKVLKPEGKDVSEVDVDD